MAEGIASTSQSFGAAGSSSHQPNTGPAMEWDAATVADKATKSAQRRLAMTDYADAIESLEEELASEGLRRRVPWDTLSIGSDDLLEGDDASDLVSEDDGVGCPLPSTPVEQGLLESEVRFAALHIAEVLKAGVLMDEIDLGALAHNAVGQAEEFVRKVMASWNVCHFHHLPKWLQDNDFLKTGHRPPLNSFRACFSSIFRVHTETGNIWTHLLGCVMFIGIAAYFLSTPAMELPPWDKAVFGVFFAGAIICLGLSFAYHTVHCHSELVGKLFSKLDYCGIAMLIIGSFVPWLYYSFYCHFSAKVIYLSVVIVLGISSIVVSMWDRFGEPKYRPVRAGVFMGFGLSGVVPAFHYAISEGLFKALSQASLGWLILMGCLYILGAMFYALRVPERFFPGKCDIWFQSHQIFHVLVIAAAFVHYHGISEMAMYRMTIGECAAQNPAMAF
ncbi:Adiponectin receptor protein [Frankliniella fusca]|uniref:Adiponectin receptor protein n=1 Tax=Frankliniella fusca TaxID=407009 RepID=A0AAE1HIK8_9NEOP|nr:Adiponectin receptor protein [Frankliniella fusca]